MNNKDLNDKLLEINNKNDNNLRVICLFFISCIPEYAIKGFVISSLWDWFIQPLGCNHMSIVSGIGLYFIYILLSNIKKYNTETPGNYINSLFVELYKYIAIYIAGFILHLMI